MQRGPGHTTGASKVGNSLPVHRKLTPKVDGVLFRGSDEVMGSGDLCAESMAYVQSPRRQLAKRI